MRGRCNNTDVTNLKKALKRVLSKQTARRYVADSVEAHNVVLELWRAVEKEEDNEDVKKFLDETFEKMLPKLQYVSQTIKGSGHLAMQLRDRLSQTNRLEEVEDITESESEQSVTPSESPATPHYEHLLNPTWQGPKSTEGVYLPQSTFSAEGLILQQSIASTVVSTAPENPGIDPLASPFITVWRVGVTSFLFLK